MSEQFWSDSRLAIVLDASSQAQQWQHFEIALNQRIVRVYKPKLQLMCLDSAKASGYSTVSEDGLFQFGVITFFRTIFPAKTSQG